MARSPERRQRWSAPEGGKEFAEVDLNSTDGKKVVNRAPSKAGTDQPSEGRRPRGGDREVDPIDREGMSRSMQKRIARARAEGERTGQQRSADERAALQREISDLRGRQHRIEISGKVSSEETAHNQVMKQLEARLEKAHADGNHTEAASVQREMTQKDNAWLERKRALLATPVEAPRREDTRKAAGPAPEGQAWIEANADWYDQPGFEAETAAAIALDQKLIAEGSDVNSPRHYKKIQKELAKKFRSINVLDPDGEALPDDRDDDRDGKRGEKRGQQRERDLDDEDQDEDRDDDDDDDDDEDEEERQREADAVRARQKPAFMNMEDAGGRGRSRRTLQVRNGKVVLTAADRANMLRFGHDPDNDAHVKNYAQTLAEQAEDDE